MTSKLLTRNSMLLPRIHAIKSHGCNMNRITASKVIQTKTHPVIKLSQSLFSHTSISNSANSELQLEDFYFQDAKPENFDEYVDILLKYFVPRNELYSGVGIDPKDPSLKRIIERRVRRGISAGISYFLVHRPTKETAAVILNDFKTRETHSVYIEEDFESFSKPVQYMQKFLYSLEKACTVFNDPSVKKLFCCEATTVTLKFEGLGLASVYTARANQIARDTGCDGIITECSTVKTQAVCEKLGYQEVGSLDYENFVVDGKKVINMNALKHTTRAVSYFLDLRNSS